MVYQYFPLLTPATLWTFAALIALLTVFQLIAWCAPSKKFSDLNKRLKAWWYIFALFAIVFATRLPCLILMWMVISFFALREYFNAIPKIPEHKRVRLWLYLSIPIQYIFILTNSYILFLVFIPVYVYLLFPLRMIIASKTQGFVQAIGTMFWGIMMAGYSLSYVAYLSVYASNVNLPAGPLGLLLFLLILTECNDASQYLFGKLFGKHKITSISPKKTFEGLFGGLLTCIMLSLLLAPHLTPLTPLFAALVGLIICAGGFLGDITLSALKRDLQIKDFGHILPGHGGLLDRIDSLIFTAPLFFYIIYWTTS